jgi:hypothetical protein
MIIIFHRQPKIIPLRVDLSAAALSGSLSDVIFQEKEGHVAMLYCSPLMVFKSVVYFIILHQI